MYKTYVIIYIDVPVMKGDLQPFITGTSIYTFNFHFSDICTINDYNLDW